jgi:hypothetical protein
LRSRPGGPRLPEVVDEAMIKADATSPSQNHDLQIFRAYFNTI